MTAFGLSKMETGLKLKMVVLLVKFAKLICSIVKPKKNLFFSGVKLQEELTMSSYGNVMAPALFK